MTRKNNTVFLILFCIFFLLQETKIHSNEKDVYEVKAEKIKYIDKNNVIIAEGKAIAKNNYGKIISADKIIYNKSKKILQTFKNSKYKDGKNLLSSDQFEYNTNTKVIKAYGNVVFIDKNKNQFFLDNFIYNEIKEIGSGDNIRSRLIDGSYIQSKNGLINNKTNTIELKQVNYTTCKNIKNTKDQFCPSWSLNSNKVIHDKKGKKIIHKNALLKLKKLPIFYTPYLSHPDPSVKRQSGFLPPLIKTINNIGRTTKVPYFWAISEDKDLTFTPVYYFDEHNLYQMTYRQQFKNSFLIIENGYSDGYKRLNRLNRTSGSRNYFYLDYKTEKDNILFKKNNIDLKLQRVSQENFLRVNKINTNLFKEDTRNLENSVKISSYENNKRLELKVGIFENLDTSDSQKYTYYLPDGLFSFNQKFKKKYNLNLDSYFQGKKFLKNQKQAKVRNIIFIEKNPNIYKKIGISSKINTSLINNNIYNNNVSELKGNSNIDNYFTLAVDNILPLTKVSKQKYQTITPRVFFKYTTGSMQNANNNNKILNYADVFSLNRTNDLDRPETGLSLGHGVEYILSQNKLNSFESLYKSRLGIGQVLRKKAEKNMPNKSSLNNKNSDLVGFLELNVFGEKNNFTDKYLKDKITFANIFDKNQLKFKYNFNLDNDLSQFNQNNLSLSATYRNFFSEITFDEKNNYIGNKRSASINLKKIVSNNYYLAAYAKKNLKNDKSELNKVSINYENDCLTSSLAISNNFYFDKDISKSTMLIFSITIKPFSDSFAPDLTDFIK